jgi:hypothetical protein
MVLLRAAGIFSQYTLTSVVSGERDLVRVCTNYRHGENLYLYRAGQRRLLRDRSSWITPP